MAVTTLITLKNYTPDLGTRLPLTVNIIERRQHEKLIKTPENLLHRSATERAFVGMKRLIILSGLGIVLVAVFTIVIMYFSATNREIDLSTQISAQKTVLGNYYDKMWKILKQKAGVTEQYRGAFKDIYTGLIAGRYSNSNDGTLMKMIQESNPNFDASLYKDLMNSIEIERTGFYNEQNRLIDLGREHDNLLRKAPSRWFISAQHIPIKIITSQTTEDVMRSGQDNNIQLFD